MSRPQGLAQERAQAKSQAADDAEPEAVRAHDGQGNERQSRKDDQPQRVANMLQHPCQAYLLATPHTICQLVGPASASILDL